MKDLLKSEAGFTLLELIVVVAVIGILAAIIVPQVNDIRDDADKNSVRSSLASIQTALERYNLDSDQGDGEYPGTTNWDDSLGIQEGSYNYSTDTEQDAYSVYYGESFESSFYYVTSDKNGIQSTDTEPNW